MSEPIYYVLAYRIYGDEGIVRFFTDAVEGANFALGFQSETDSGGSLVWRVTFGEVKTGANK